MRYGKVVKVVPGALKGDILRCQPKGELVIVKGPRVAECALVGPKCPNCPHSIA